MSGRPLSGVMCRLVSAGMCQPGGSRHVGEGCAGAGVLTGRALGRALGAALHAVGLWHACMLILCRPAAKAFLFLRCATAAASTTAPAAASVNGRLSLLSKPARCCWVVSLRVRERVTPEICRSQASPHACHRRHVGGCGGQCDAPLSFASSAKACNHHRIMTLHMHQPQAQPQPQLRPKPPPSP
jgi:hypothetical protein